MSNGQSIADRISELTSEKYAQLVRICKARRERERIGGGPGGVTYELGVPDEIAEVLKEKGLAHRGPLSTTAASEPAYQYYLDNLADT